MRPLRLEMEGFTAFRQPVDLDFSQLDLFAITGPTGAGKSSLIDAISYALYGRVPRVTNEVSSCIAQGMDRMHVALEFMAGEERYRIHRETRRKGQGNVRLERWRQDGWQPLVDRARDVNAEVGDIVGLDYEGFIRSVILPQGQFQEFLTGSTEKRRAVLRSLLRLEVYDRMRARASASANEIKARYDERRRTLESLAEATPENVECLAGELETAVKLVAALQDEIKALDSSLTLALTLSHAREALVRCEAEAGAALAEFDKTSRLVADGEGELTRLTRDQGELEQQLKLNLYDAERHTSLGVALERVKALAQTRSSIEQLTKQHGDASKQAANAGAAVEKATRAHAAAEQALAAAEAARNEAQRHDLAASLQQGLQPGDACPVCGGKIGVLKTVDGGGLSAAEKKLAGARQADADARGSLAAAANAAARALAVAESCEARLEEIKTGLARQEASVAEVLTAGEEATPAAVSAALTAQLEARTRRREIEQQLKQCSDAVLARRAQLDEARQRVAALEQRARAATAAREAAQAGALKARTEVEAVIGQRWTDVVAALQEDRDVAAPLRRRHDEAQSRRGQTQNSIGQMEARLERLKADAALAEELRRGLDGLKKEQDVAADLAQMLGAAKFQTFLQYEALHTLARDGSTRLEQLSNGRYKLQIDERGADFEVIDQWNADQARSVKTLSGGETFLASLALSLALAESLPGLAASRRIVLDSIFLDEGFGSLDPEALDRAADALDALRSEDRMVCVVTHLQELAQRLPARVVVTRTESGSTVAIA